MPLSTQGLMNNFRPLKKGDDNKLNSISHIELFEESYNVSRLIADSRHHYFSQ